MTKYLESERFIVNSNTKEAIKNYADNYDRIFGEKASGALCPTRPGTSDVVHGDIVEGRCTACGARVMP